MTDKKLKCWAISDTHGFHGYLTIPKDIDLVIFGGDATNSRQPKINQVEMLNFLKWYDNLDIPYKVMIGGNHDTSIWAGLVNPKEYKNIIYLEHEIKEVAGIKIFGSPYTPSFGIGWAWNVNRGKLQPYWKEIPKNTDILVTHGPPKGILDLTTNRDGYTEYCGDKELLNEYYFNHDRISPKFHIFGHIHNFEYNINAGTRTVNGLNTTFINASSVEDGRFDLGLTSYGIVFEI